MAKYTKSRWRKYARAAIEKGINESGHITDPAELKKQISLNYYPFGERAHHPYKIWLDELKKRFADAPDGEPVVSVRDYWVK